MPKIASVFLSVLVILMVITLFIGETLPASAAIVGPSFVVMNTSESLPDGIWFRRSPYIADTDRVTGHGVYAGDVVQLSCYAFGDAVGPYNDRLWYYVANLTRPYVPGTGLSNIGYLNAHYVNDGEAANMVDPGVPTCVTNSHWSGYATTGHRYNDVKGSWVEPVVNCSSPGENADSVFWVGLDSYPSGPLEQIGTEAACKNGIPSYKFWYELTPAKAVVFSNPVVSPNDTLTGEVITTFDGRFTFTLHDTTKGWTYSTVKTSTAGSGAGGYSAEWIAEAPLDFCSNGKSDCLAPLANFGTVKFTGCVVNGVALSQIFGTDVEILMQNGSTLKAPPSALGSDGKSFSVTWYHS